MNNGKLSLKVVRYRTERACSLADRHGNAIDDKLLPNGTGVVLGLSLNVNWARKYIAWCKDTSKKQPASAKTLEKTLGAALQVNPMTLRAYFKEADLLLDLSPTVSIVIEAGYEPIKPGNHTKDDLKRMAMNRYAQSEPDADTDVGNGLTRLQVLRMRVRLQDLAQKRSVIGGYGAVQDSEILGTSTAREGFEALAFRTFRAEHESTWDLRTWYYGRAQKIFNDPNPKAKRSYFDPALGAEHGIAPVALFNF